MEDSDSVRNSIDGAEVAHAVQAGSIGSLHIGGSVKRSDIRESYKAAYSTLVAINSEASKISWSVDSLRRAVKDLESRIASLEGMSADFDLFAPHDVLRAFWAAQLAAALLRRCVVDDMVRAAVGRDGPGSDAYFAARNSMINATNTFVEKVRASIL
ncbi:hypothetical protein [Kitasatospora purpeofusca]|uniref:hypothetical protein n=1 Tax=Kitasatospora purpeofusca TaxID=67352 RepID=UPI00382B9B6B